MEIFYWRQKNMISNRWSGMLSLAPCPWLWLLKKKRVWRGSMAMHRGVCHVECRSFCIQGEGGKGGREKVRDNAGMDTHVSHGSMDHRKLV